MSRTDDWGDGWNEGREQAIRDCIAAIEAKAPEIYCDSAPCWGIEYYVKALRALLKGDQ